MVQNSTFVPTVLMQGEIELVIIIYLKYIIMRIFNDIICMTALPWQHKFKIFCICHLQKCIDKGPCTFRPIHFANIEKWKIAFPLQFSASVKMGNCPDASFEGRLAQSLIRT